MTTADQDEVIDLLSSPATYGGEPVERIDTHASVVFLEDDRAWKLKRAVRYEYLDFSTPERRHTLCEAELRINRRTAPSLYRRVVAVTREADGRLALGGSGSPVDWVIEMTRFDQEDLFDRRAARGALDISLMRPLGKRIARFHEEAEVRRDHGGRAGMAWVVDGNAHDLSRAGEVLDPAECEALIVESRAALDRLAPLLDSRRDAGKVRQCHGDLHLRNIVFFEGEPTLFDGVEFNDEIACVDVLYDLAFLLMDLSRRGLREHANAVFNGYLSETADFDGLALMPLFLASRSAVRAKTSIAGAAVQSDPERRKALHDTARDYLRMALRLIRPAPASVVAVGGLSGTGKSSLDLALAPALDPVPGAVVLRSDELRKRLSGVDELARLDASAYSRSESNRVYKQLAEQAAAAARAGQSVIVDAVFLRPEDRLSIEEAAARASVPFIGLWLEAPADVLRRRVEQRRGDASDADAAIVRKQLEQEPGDIRWSRITAAENYAAVLQKARMLTRMAKGRWPMGNVGGDAT
jgi:aminoglycoside phosphotransferase family enzyme/predicted kinase